MITENRPAEYTFAGYRIDAVKGRVTPALVRSATRFWLNQGVITDATQAARRAEQLVCIILDSGGEIAGVSTAGLDTLNGRPYHFLRTFIRPDARRHGLGIRLLNASVSALEAASQSQPGPAGVLLIAQNPKLTGAVAERLFSPAGFQLIGQTQQQQDIWKRDFSNQARIG